jgi:hypothetical protein
MKLKLLLLSFSLIPVALQAQIQDGAAPYFNVKILYSYAVQEDVKSILSILDTLPAHRLPDSLANLKERYRNRFVYNKENYPYATPDSTLREAIDIYRSYWTPILLKIKTIAAQDAWLKETLAKWLLKKYRAPYRWKMKAVQADPLRHFSLLLWAKGYYNNVEGKTGNLYDIYIWKKQDTVIHTVQLPKAMVKVPVLFMKDIITLGWEEYASFGGAYPGGWPQKGMLYCVAKAYDTTTEKFKVSYLGHEAQHFWDLKHHPLMASWRLEYRAKLTELSLAQETVYQLLDNFARGARDGDTTLTHPYAEYCVLRDLKKEVTGNSLPTDLDWKTIDAGLINQKAATLLRRDFAIWNFKAYPGSLERPGPEGF